MERPNILVVMTDQQRADLRKSRGYALDTMPFLDRWAEGGVDFTNAYTPNPTCMPARVSMFTGRYPSCHHVRTNHNAADAYYGEDLLDVLRRAGYRTALCGKNHSHHKPQDFDFHECTGHMGNEGETNETAEQRAFAEFLCGTRHMEVDCHSPGGVEVQHPYRNVTSAFRFIDETPANRPFFAWVSFAEPHNPYQVPEPYFNLFPPESLPQPYAGVDSLTEKGWRWPWLRGVWESVLGPDIEKRILRSRSNYHGMLRLIDDQFKRLMEGLDERGLAENTLVFFMSDHGDFVGEYGLIRKGPDLPDMLTRVPLAIRGPRVKPQGMRADAMVNLVDVLPTVCEAIGEPIPLGAQGKSLGCLLRGEKCPPREYDVAYAESGFSGLYWNDGDRMALEAEGAINPLCTFDCLNSWTQCGQVRMARKGPWKIQEDMMGQVYLYNLETDPREIHNLAEDKAFLPVRAEMLTELCAATLRACDPLPTPRNRYRTKLHPKGYWWDDSYVSDDPGVKTVD
jgi:arylsulfatase A-like enzyme